VAAVLLDAGADSLEDFDAALNEAAKACSARVLSLLLSRGESVHGSANIPLWHAAAVHLETLELFERVFGRPSPDIEYLGMKWQADRMRDLPDYSGPSLPPPVPVESLRPTPTQRIGLCVKLAMLVYVMWSVIEV
jgi:hypothetical protein